MRAAAAEHQAALGGGHAEDLLGQEAGNPFAGQGGGGHDECYLDRAPVAEYHVEVDEHTHSDEEERDEEGVAHELEMALEGGYGRYQTVEQDTGEEGSEDALQSGHFHQPGCCE